MKAPTAPIIVTQKMLTSLLFGLALRQTPASQWLWGVTVDDTTNIVQIVDALGKMPARTTTRVVFDPGMSPSSYSADVAAIHNVANVMGEPIDSEPYNTKLTVAQYRARMVRFMDGLPSTVDIWEIGNEVNGEWTGAPSIMGQKIAAAYDEAKKRGLKTAVTLFYSDSYAGTTRDMARWSSLYIPRYVREGVDYVLVSHYPTTTQGGPNWSRVFRDLGVAYRKAKLGFGELGLATPDGNLSTDAVAKQQLIKKFYAMPSPNPTRYIGGYFWWTFAEDAVPRSTATWKTLASVIH